MSLSPAEEVEPLAFPAAAPIEGARVHQLLSHRSVHHEHAPPAFLQECAPAVIFHKVVHQLPSQGILAPKSTQHGRSLFISPTSQPFLRSFTCSYLDSPPNAAETRIPALSTHVQGALHSDSS
eukprot:1160202-Pelagomonas_calceolata.AAC.12